MERGFYGEKPKIKEQRSLPSLSDSDGRCVESRGTIPNGFALLTAAPENGWSCGWLRDWSPSDPLSTYDPYPWSLSIIDSQCTAVLRQLR